jgi:hypothetical protein
MQSHAGGGAAANHLQTIRLAPTTSNLRLIYANDQADELRRNVDVDPSGLFRFEQRLWQARHTERPTCESSELDYLVCVEQATDEATPERSPPASATQGPGSG